MRTHDQCFQDVLDDVRIGKFSDRVRDFLADRKRPIPEDFKGTYLFARKEPTAQLNLQKLELINSPLKTFPTEFTGKSEIVERLKKYSPLPDVLHLKLGALVMLRQNDPRGKFVNGSTGILTRMEPTSVTIELLKGDRVHVEKVSFSLLNDECAAVASLSNFPLTLAYATTIHKAQGSTLERMAVDLRALWEPGQAYVALSRMTSGTELYVQDFSPGSIRADSEVFKFLYTSHQA